MGVAALDGNSAVNIKARKAVVLTTGGYAGNSALVEILYPTFKNVRAKCSPSVTGDGLVMAAECKAVVIRTGTCPGMEPALNYDNGTTLVWDAILVVLW
ncbi:MAG: hypothetical protein LBI64_04775 [Coriobacteriales bacterium]|nr:hypothetical protein [Coriobacteriales bacterium]